MPLPRRQQRLLQSISDELTDADPQLARQLQTFGQLGREAPMPESEQLPADTNRFWSALWAALGAGAWLMPEQYLAMDAGMPDATLGPRLPGLGPSSWPSSPSGEGKRGRSE